MANKFKRTVIDNYDGYGTNESCTNANTAFVDTFFGDDSSGDGTREYPYKSYAKAILKSGIVAVNFRGILNEYCATKPIYGDDINQIVIASNYTVNCNYRCFTINKTYAYVNAVNVIIKSIAETSVAFDISKSLFLSILNGNGYNNKFTYSTLKSFDTQFRGNATYNNLIIYDSYHFRTLIETESTGLLNVVFPSDCKFYNGDTLITNPIWTNDSIANVQLLRNAMLSVGITQSVVDYYFPKNIDGSESCKIILEERNGGTNPNIFAEYNADGSVKNYALNPDINNEALYASSTGSYVGCFPAANAVSEFTEPIKVNADGSETTDAGDLLVVGTDGSLDFNNAALQTWNRIKNTSVIKIPSGEKFSGATVMSVDGTLYGKYFGKHQNLIDATALVPTDALEANTHYRVINENEDLYGAVVYNGNTYLPNSFFSTNGSVLAFALNNADSGTVIKKLLANPLESIEVIPYDNITHVSASFPKFSCRLNGDCQMLYHKIGANIDKPVLFSEVTNSKIAYYQGYAVTNADEEFVTLIADTTNYYSKVPTLQYLKVEVNAHKDSVYGRN